MKRGSLLIVALLLVVCFVGHRSPASAADDAKDTPRPSVSAIEKEIQATADSFVAAFKTRDAAALAGHWAPGGVYINEDGQRFEGRETIQSEYEKLFAEIPEGVQLRVEIDSVRSINPQTVIEEGRVALTPQSPGAVRVMSRYTAVHAKHNDGWLLADVRDTRVELPPETGVLKDLEWLVGTWSATNENARVEVKVRWIENDHFLARSHTAVESGKVTSGGLEIIGVDPFTGRITSWTFNNDGSHARGIWSPHENGWVVESVGAMTDGTPATATYLLSRKDGATLLWNKPGGENPGGQNHGLFRYSNSDLRRRGDYVRRDFHGHNYYSSDWYRRYPGAWHPQSWAYGNPWAVITWESMNGWFGYGGAQPMYYDYGSNVTYQDNSVYVNNQNVGTSDQYYQQAQTLASTAAQSPTTDDEQWLPLGVFAMTHDDQTKANLILQLAVNKQGIIRGNYTATLTDDTKPVQGSVDKKTQRAAWTIGTNTDNVIETGIYNLTKDEAPALVHFGKDRTEQWLLVRLKQDEQQQESPRQ